MKKNILLLLLTILLLCGCSKVTKCECGDDSLNHKISIEIKHDKEKITQYKEHSCEKFETTIDAINQYEKYLNSGNAKDYTITRTGKTVCALKEKKDYDKTYSQVLNEMEEICTCK